MRRPSHGDDRQSALALVSGRPVSDADRAAAARRHTLGTGDDKVGLEWRAERQQYAVAWYERAARTRRRVATGVGAGEGADPPRTALEALAARFSARVRPAVAQAPAEVGVSAILTRYLADHCVDLGDSARPAYAVLNLEAFIAGQRRTGAIVGVLTAADLGKTFVTSFAKHRRDAGVADATIKRELGVLRSAINWAAEDGLLASKPHIPKLQGKGVKLVTRPRQLAYTLPQLAALFDAASLFETRHHVRLFMVAMLATHARTEAVLECDLDLQLYDDVIDWLGPQREQTKKRRSAAPVGPTFGAWLTGRRGKLIRESRLTARATWAKPDVPEYRERDVWSIDTAFEHILIDAGGAHPSLKLRRPLLDERGEQRTQIVKTARKPGGGWIEAERPLWTGVGSPNTIRHTIHSQLRRIGVPKGQIDAASGHAEEGTGENYNHLDARHDLKDFTAGVEQLFDELRAYTTAHLRSHCGPKIIDLGAARAARSA